MATAAIMKNHKNRDISPGGFTHLREIWCASAKWVS